MSLDARTQGGDAPSAEVLTSRFSPSTPGMQYLFAVHDGLATFKGSLRLSFGSVGA